jgi:trimethylamine--corrinoid protein Co-methyltransferase
MAPEATAATARPLRERARARARAILAEHYPANLDPKVDAELRARFPIRLPAEAMRPAAT